jgi:hypothetical protein
MRSLAFKSFVNRCSSRPHCLSCNCSAQPVCLSASFLHRDPWSPLRTVESLPEAVPSPAIVPHAQPLFLFSMSEFVATVLRQDTFHLFQEPPKLRISRDSYEIGNQTEPLNAKLASFPAGFPREACICITLSLAPTSIECQKMWALIFSQENRRMTLTAKAPSELEDIPIMLSGVVEALRWTHPSEALLDSLGRGDLRVIICQQLL